MKKRHPFSIGDLVENQPRTVFAFNHNRDFRTDVLFIRTEITVGARSAQWPRGTYDSKGAEGCVVTLIYPRRSESQK
jgi:hypothetical protein